MPTFVTLPALGESVTEGTIVRWLKSVGDDVAFEEPLVEVSTDKVDTEIPAPAAGRLVEITAAEDEVVPVGARLAVIEAAGADAVEGSAQAEPPAAKPSRPVSTDSTETVPPASNPGGFITPLVRRLAHEHGIDLATVTGNGIGGRIRKQDVLEAVAARAAADEPAPTIRETARPTTLLVDGRTEKLSTRRKVIAARMVESLQTSAQLTSVVEADVTRIWRQREAEKGAFSARHGVALTYLPFFAKATLDALKRYPALNASIDTQAGEVTYFQSEHLAIAVDTERGLLTPVIRNAGDLSMTGLARGIADLAHRARNGQIKPDELSGGTFTLTNTGSRGSLFDTPIINQPQVAVLGTGAVVKKVVVVDDDELGETIAVRRMMYLALTYDHRLVDGADAARFLADIKTGLEDGGMRL